MAKPDIPFRKERRPASGQTPLRLTALAFVLGLLVIIVRELYSTVQTGGTAANLFGEVITDLPFLIIPVIILFYLLSRYLTGVEKAQAKIRYQALLVDNVADAIIATDLDLTIVSWNKGAERIYGWTPEEARGKNVIEFLKTQFHHSTREEVLALLSKEGSVRGEVSQVCKDGRVIDVKGSTSALVDVDGTRMGYVNIGVDVTEARRAEEALKGSEERFRSIFESSGVGIGIATPDGRIIEANPTLRSMLGLSETEIRETRISEYIHPDDLERVKAARDKMLATEAVDYQSEERFGHKGGRYRWLARTESSVRGPDGKPLYTVAILEDITSRKEVQEALRLSEQEYLLLFTNMPDAFAYFRMVLDETGKPVDCVFLKVNEQFEKLTGQKAADIVGRRFTEAIPGVREDKFDWIGTFGKVALEGKSVAFEEFSEALHKWYLVSAYSPKKGYFCVVFTDVTERMKAKEVLAESEAKFRAAFENASLGATLTSLDGTWLRVNQALVDMLGYSAEELTARPFIEFLVPEDREETVRRRASLMAGDTGSYAIEQRYVRRDGRVISVSSNDSIVRGPSGESLYTVALMADITKRKLAEEELRMYSTRLEELVKERTAELEVTHRALLESERLATIGRVSTQMAHDLRNPLAGIKTEAYILGELLPKSLDPKAKETLRLLSSSADHAEKVIEDLLEYTRKLEPSRQRLELGAFVAGAARDYPIPKDVTLVVEKAPKAYVLAENAQLAKAVNALIENAVDAMPRGGKLNISFGLKAGSVSFSVADTGVGIGKADLPKVFQPFYTTKAKGLGLGLTIARKIAEAHGGSLELKSTLGVGTKVTVTLPTSETLG